MYVMYRTSTYIFIYIYMYIPVVLIQFLVLHWCGMAWHGVYFSNRYQRQQSSNNIVGSQTGATALRNSNEKSKIPWDVMIKGSNACWYIVVTVSLKKKKALTSFYTPSQRSRNNEAHFFSSSWTNSYFLISPFSLCAHLVQTKIHARTQ